MERSRSSGAIFGADADLANPLAYGYNQKTDQLV